MIFNFVVTYYSNVLKLTNTNERIFYFSKPLIMKRILCLSLLLSLNVNATFGQTFTKTQLTNLSGGATIIIPVSGVPSGYVLQQVNLKFGDGTSSYSANIYQANVTLKKPGVATVKSLITTTSLGGGSISDLKWFNIHLRDVAGYKTPAAQKGPASESVNAGYPFNYGFYAPAESWSAFNSGSQNGSWELNINSIGSTTYQRKFNTVELIFGPALPAPINIKNGNQSCATRKCIQTGNTYLATNNSYVSQNNPSQLFDGCRWNADDNNKSWFYFVASSSTAEISFSGLESRQQSVIVKAGPTNNCLNPFTAIPTGGCMGTMAGSISDQKYYNSGYAPGTGLRFNHGYSLSGLTIGSMYVIVIEGSEDADSDFLIDITSGASGGCSPLPISLLSFTATPTQQGVSLNWSTASERNNDYFTISRSSDLENWEEVGTVKGSGNSNYKIDYDFTDIAPLDEVSYYRLKQTDYNGENESFDPVSVEINANRLENALVVYPNPTKAGFDVQVYAKSMNLATVSVHNVAGKRVINQTVQLEKGKNMVPMKNEKLEQGVYLVKIQFEDGTACLTKLVVD